MANKTHFGPTEGIYNPVKRYAFTNWTVEDFLGQWNGDTVTIPCNAGPRSTVTLPEYLAVKFTRELVDREMIRELGSSALLSVPSARAPYEQKTVRDIPLDETDPQVQLMVMQARDQVMADITAQINKEAPKAPASIAEMAPINEEAAKGLEEFTELGKAAKKRAPQKPKGVATV